MTEKATNDKMLDIAHISFLEMIELFIKTLGAAQAKGALMRSAISTAESFPEAKFESMQDFVAAIEDLRSPIAQVEGKAVHLGDGLFGLPRCPFGGSIKNFVAVRGKLPESFAKVAEDFNKPGAVTSKYRVGQGAGVSPFCAIHQPLRSALGLRVSIGGKSVSVYQLGCKSGNGTKAIAEDLCKAAGRTPDEVKKVLDDNMCCYQLRLE